MLDEMTYLVKRFKVCHIFEIYDDSGYSLFTFLANSYFSLMTAMVYVNIGTGSFIRILE